MDPFDPEPSRYSNYASSPDEDLMHGMMSDTRGDGQNYYTVSELVVTAAPITNMYAIDQINILWDQYSGLDYTDFSIQKVDEAITAGTNAYTLETNAMSLTTAGAAISALQKLYLAAKSNQATVDGPSTETLTMNELNIFQIVLVDVGVHSQLPPAYTQAYGDGSARIYIDASRLADYTNAFGLEKGINYVVYHELAHALGDSRSWDSAPNREAYTNEYGQILAEITGAVYPSDAELALVGGTIAR